MQLTPKQIQLAFNALTALSDKDKDKSYTFPSMARIRMGGNLRRVRAVLEEIIEQQNELVKKHGTEVAGKPGTFEVLMASEQRAAFDAELKAFFAEKIEVDIQPMTEAELANPRIVKSRNDKGQLSENFEENQVPFDVIADLQTSGVLPTT